QGGARQLAAVGHDQVRAAVRGSQDLGAVGQGYLTAEIGNHHGVRRLTAEVVRGGLERAVPVAQHEGNTGYFAVVGQDEVQVAVAVQVGNGRTRGLAAAVGTARVGKRPVTISQVEIEAVLLAAGHDQVEAPVVVEIGQADVGQ